MREAKTIPGIRTVGSAMLILLLLSSVTTAQDNRSQNAHIEKVCVFPTQSRFLRSSLNLLCGVGARDRLSGHLTLLGRFYKLSGIYVIYITKIFVGCIIVCLI